MRETPDDLRRLQALLDISYQAAGAHLKSIITPERRLTAEQLADRLEGMCLLTLATVTTDGRPINGPVDGFFYRADWYFGSSTDSLRFRHIATRPSVSATHMPAEAFSVTAHGRATVVDLGTHDEGGLRRVVFDYYARTFGDDPSGFLDSGVAYARIDAERLFTFYLSSEEMAAGD